MTSPADTAPIPLLDPRSHRPGTVLAGRYRLTRHIATGGMGQVWAAEDLVLHRRVAVKVLRDDLAEQPAFLDRFEHEARLAASVTHPRIATLHDYVRDDTRRPHSFLVMELVDGEPLSAMLRRTPTPPLGTTVRVLAQSADALAAAHRNGVVHRDVKPANILLDEDRQVKLTDFGIAGPVDEASAARRAEVLGTPHYMSPEQARGEPVTAASDLYSLGVVAYQMLSGRLPFQGDTPTKVIDGHLHGFPPPLPERVPAHISGVVMSALAKDPVDRPIDAAAFARALRSTSPSASATGSTAVVPAILDERTAVMPTYGDDATTRIDPTEVVVASATDAPRRRRLGGLFWATTAAVAVAALVVTVGAASDDVQVVPVETTTPSTNTVAATIAPAASPTTQQAAPGQGKGNDKGKGNGKDKGNGKGG